MIILLTIYLTGFVLINWIGWLESTQFASDLTSATYTFIRSVVWPILLPVLTIIILFEWIKWMPKNLREAVDNSPSMVMMMSVTGRTSLDYQPF